MGARRHFGCTHRSPNFFHKMFWGLIVEPGKKYSQVVENPFHISKATIDLSVATEDNISLLLDYEGQPEYILCHLNKTNKQESLDLNFQQGDTISLFTQGQCPIHLTGYLLGEDDSDDEMTLGEMMEEEGEEGEDDEEEEEEEEEDEVVDVPAKGNKRPMPVNGKATAPQKKKKMEAEDKVVEAKEAEVAAPQTLSKNQKKKLAKQKKAESGDAPAPAKGQAQPNKNKDGKAQPNKKQNNAQKKNWIVDHS